MEKAKVEVGRKLQKITFTTESVLLKRTLYGRLFIAPVAANRKTLRHEAFISEIHDIFYHSKII